MAKRLKSWREAATVVEYGWGPVLIAKAIDLGMVTAAPVEITRKGRWLWKRRRIVEVLTSVERYRPWGE